jgi:hypothetical protein
LAVHLQELTMASRRTILALIGWLPLAGCAAAVPEVSRWTPPDFTVDVREVTRDPDGLLRIARRFQVWADGLAAWRESSGVVVGPNGPVPVFDTVAVYELHPNSLRMLGRLLYRAGLMEDRGGLADGRGVESGDTVIRWSAFGDTGVVASWSEDPVVFDRLLHVVNAFVPDGRTFGEPKGEVVHRHVADVPEPVTSVRGAVRAHEWLTEIRPDDEEIAGELRALRAIVSGRAEPRAR